MEEANRNQNLRNQNKNSIKDIADTIMNQAPQVLQNVDQMTPEVLKRPIGDSLGITGREQPAPPVEYDDSTYSTGQTTGSSITNSGVMNSQAAGQLYTGNTDAALASQYGGMNQGGVVSDLNPVMGNDGKFTTPQKGIQDNPFLKQAKDKGVI